MGFNASGVFSPDPVEKAAAFNIDVLGPEISHTAWNTVAFNVSYWRNGARTNTGNLNDEVVFACPALRGGMWNLGLLVRTASDRGIIHLAASSDGTNWTDVTTVDCYAAGNTTPDRKTVTGVTVPDGTRYWRLRVASKNASSSSYAQALQGFAGVRTGN